MKLAPWPVRSNLRAKPSPLELAQKTAANWRALSTFRMNTCKSVSKQSTLTAFRMNTYAKTGGRVPPVPTRHAVNSPFPRRSFGAIRSLHRLGAVRSIDADILRGKVAGPIPSGGRTVVQVHHDGHMVG